MGLYVLNSYIKKAFPNFKLVGTLQNEYVCIPEVADSTPVLGALRYVSCVSYTGRYLGRNTCQCTRLRHMAVADLTLTYLWPTSDLPC